MPLLKTPLALLLLLSASLLDSVGAATVQRSRAGWLRGGNGQGFQQGFEQGYELGLQTAAKEQFNESQSAGGRKLVQAEHNRAALAWSPRAHAPSTAEKLIFAERSEWFGRSGRSQGDEATWSLHHFCGMLVFIVFAGLVLSAIPLIKSEWTFYKEHIDGSQDHFSVYLAYRFTDWFTTRKYAPGLVLLFLTMGLIVAGAIIYSLMVGKSPTHSLWRIFVWSTGSPAEGEGTPAGRFLGILVTVCGLIILSLLLGIVTDMFTTKMTEIKQGLSKVVEGGHVVILGYTECTRCLLEELANARESEGGGMFVILAQEKKDDVENALFGNTLHLESSRMVVRSGSCCAIRDLHKVAANSAGQVVIMSDTSISPEEADAKSIRTLLALMTKGWPTNGRIVVQCASEANRNLFRNIYPGKEVEVVVVGNIVAKLMAQTSRMHGLATVFGMMLGFEGDEFYSEEWPDLIGTAFRDAVFRFPQAVVLGIFSAEGECILNPGWDYKIQEGDRIIVLAEDNDAYCLEDEPYYLPPKVDAEQPKPSKNVSEEELKGRVCRESTPTKTLIIGWNNNIGPLLLSLDAMAAHGSSIAIYSPRPIQDREQDIAKLEQRLDHKLEAVSITHVQVENEDVSSRLELQKIKHHEHDSIFILAEGATRAKADERTMAVLTQLNEIGAKIPAADRKPFDPVVEMCEDSTAEHLKICGFTNFVHSNSLISQALAAVTEEPNVNAIYHDLMSHMHNTFEFRRYKDFLAQGEEEPDMLSFGEAVHRISEAGDISLVAWSTGTPEDREWEMNPKDKTTPRPWSSDDQVVVIRRFG